MDRGGGGDRPGRIRGEMLTAAEMHAECVRVVETFARWGVYHRRGIVGAVQEILEKEV